MNLQKTLNIVREYSGVRSKQQLKQVLQSVSSGASHNIKNGDDAAALPSSDGHLLFAMEGFIPAFVAHDPWFAGWCGVMVNCSDIAAMGGRPTAITNAIWSDDDDVLRQLLRGMTAASSAFGVPIVGGHTCQNNGSNQLSVSIIGQATNLLTSFDACEGDLLICAIDLRGEYREPFLNWDAATSAPPEQLKGDIGLLPLIAAIDGVTGAKDISQAGILGTAAMFMDCSETGVDIDLSQIPKPADVCWEDWLRTFPSFGYLISCKAACAEAVKNLFQSRNIHTGLLGEINSNQHITVTFNGVTETFFDLTESRFMVPARETQLTLSETQ